MQRKKSVEQGNRIKAAIILIVIAFLAVGAYYSLEEQTVYAPVKTSEPSSASTGTATQTPAPTPTVTAPPVPTPNPTTAKPTSTSPLVPTITEATPPPTPVTTQQPAVQQTAVQPTPAQTQANKASYVSANFQSGDIKGSRITVPQGSSVDVYVVVTEYGSGILKTEVKKDIEWGSDAVLTTFQNQMIFLNGEQTIKVGTFSAGDLSGQNSFREYFIKVYWNDNVIYDPTDPSSRPAVITSPQAIGQPGTLEFQQLLFGNPPQTTLTVTKYTQVPVYLRLKAVGQVSKPVKVEIRKDKIAFPDSSFTTLEQTITMKDETRDYYIGSFTPDQTTTWDLRQYFGRVDINSDGTWDYDPQDPASRPHVLVS